jgi:ferric-dicitrate binding protein FerR (iron transport regulator)
MAYDDEPALETTLLEGAVRIIYQKNNEQANSMRLIPGQQAAMDNKGNFTLHDHINTDEIVAWTNGYFQFDKADIQTVMRQLARWYDIEVLYKGKLRNRAFVGQIRRSEPLANVLAILEQSHVHFRVEGRKIIVYS